MSVFETPRDVLIVGGPGVLAEWVTSLIRDACHLADPPPELSFAEEDHWGHNQNDASIAESVRGFIRVVIVRSPSHEVLQAIEKDITIVVGIVDDPVDSVRYLMRKRNSDFLMAMREQTAGAAAFHLLPGHPSALVVRRGTRVPARVVAEKILSHTRLPVPGNNREPLLAALCGTADQSWSLETALSQRDGYLSLSELGDAMSTADASLVLQALTPLVLGAIEKDIGTITWPGRAFYFGDKPNEAAPPLVDLTGSPRIFYYGPYFHIPPGTWSVKILLAFTEGARGLKFYLNIISHLRVIARAEFLSTGAGVFEGSLRIVHSEPSRHIEVNLMSADAAIDGHIALGQITFTKINERTSAKMQ